MATSLFGPSPLEYQQAQQAGLQQQASQYAQLNPLQRAAQGMYQAGSNLGGGIAGLMGIQDPMAEKASKIESILQGSDQTSAQGFMDLYKKFSDANLPQQAQLAAAKAQELKKAESALSLEAARAKYYEGGGARGIAKVAGAIGKVRPEAYEPESLQSFYDSVDAGKPDYKLLDPKDPTARAQALSPQGKQAAEEGNAPGTPEFKARVKELNEAKAAKPSDKAAEGVAKATSAISGVSSGLAKTEDLLNKVGGANPSIFFGPVSNFKAWAEGTGFLGEPSDNTVAQDEIRAHLTGGINAVLNEAKGVQAKDDAARAKEQIQGLLKLNTNAGATAALKRLKQAQDNVVKSNEAYIATRTTPVNKPPAQAGAKPTQGQVDYSAAFERAKAAAPAWKKFTLEQFIAAAKAKGQ